LAGAAEFRALQALAAVVGFRALRALAAVVECLAEQRRNQAYLEVVAEVEEY
jgi:hypothetical protein